MNEGNGETEYGPFAPGSLQESTPEEEVSDQGRAPFDLDARFATATFKNVDGTIDKSSFETRSHEHICVTCYHAGICKYRPAGEAEELLITISRCLAYEPDQA